MTDKTMTYRAGRQGDGAPMAHSPEFAKWASGHWPNDDLDAAKAAWDALQCSDGFAGEVRDKLAWLDFSDEITPLALQSRLLQEVLDNNPVGVAAVAKLLWQKGLPTHAAELTPKVVPQSLIEAAERLVSKWDKAVWRESPEAQRAIHHIRLGLHAAKNGEIDMRHPTVQRLVGANARYSIELGMAEDLVKYGPEWEMSPGEMEYWGTLHDMLQERLQYVPAEIFEKLDD